MLLLVYSTLYLILLDWGQDFYRVSLSELAFPVLGVCLSQDVVIQYVNALGIS